MKWHPDPWPETPFISCIISAVDASKQHPFPCPTTYRTALTHYLDITSTPRTNVLKELSEYAADAKDKDMLVKMAGATPESKVKC